MGGTRRQARSAVALNIEDVARSDRLRSFERAHLSVRHPPSSSG